jgi:hypothetical protein
MPDCDELDDRLRAVERAVTDGDADLAALRDAAALAERLDAVEERLDAVEGDVRELDAATQAVRGYVGEVRHVNRTVAERADAALARVERLEAELDDRPPPGQCRPRPRANVEMDATDADAPPGSDAPGGTHSTVGDEADEAEGSGGVLAAVRRWL